MNILRFMGSIPLFLALLLSPMAPGLSASQSGAPTQPPGCNTGGPASQAYSVTVCITSPESGAPINGNVTITATETATSSSAVVQRMVFSLNGTYLLTDFVKPYTFVLPTAEWKDGPYTLSVQTFLRDGYSTTPSTLPIKIANGISAPPTNSAHFVPATGTTPKNGGPFVVAAAGDGASGETNSLKVVKLISSINPDLFLYLGDVYEQGSKAEFYNYYGLQGTAFGAFRSITNPTVGNHEYLTNAAQGYFSYWDNIPDYYSYDAGGWHFISLNSNYNRIGVGSTSSQYQWLAQDLAAHANACTVVYYHHPLFNIGPEGATSAMSEIWALLAKNGVSIVINGHDHDYQRWAPLDGSGSPSSTGITEFVAGGGGHGLQKFKNTDKRVAFSDDMNPEAFGVLMLSLHPTQADFSYISDSGTPIDSGTVVCMKAESSISSQATATAQVESTVSPQSQAPVNPAGVATPAAPNATAVSKLPAATSISKLPANSSPAAIFPYISAGTIALGGLAVIILVGLIMIARRQF
jgi:hypothetical protein